MDVLAALAHDLIPHTLACLCFGDVLDWGCRTQCFPGPREQAMGRSFLIGWAVRTWTRTYLDLRISKILHVALGLMSSTPRSAATAMAKGKIHTATHCHLVVNSDRFVEFETAGDLKIAVDKLDNQEFKGASVRCLADVRSPINNPNQLHD